MFFLQFCLVGLPSNSLPTFTELGLWEVLKRQNYHIQIVNPAFEPHRPVRFGPGANLRFVNLCTFLKTTQCRAGGEKGMLTGMTLVRAFPVYSGSAAPGARHTEEQERDRVLLSPKYRMKSPTPSPRGERGPDVTFLSEDGHVLNYGTYKDATSLYN